LASVEKAIFLIGFGGGKSCKMLDIVGVFWEIKWGILGNQSA
jgi:hypothetical protein